MSSKYTCKCKEGTWVRIRSVRGDWRDWGEAYEYFVSKISRFTEYGMVKTQYDYYPVDSSTVHGRRHGSLYAEYNLNRILGPATQEDLERIPDEYAQYL